MNSIDNLRDYVLTAPSVCSTTRAILVGYIDDIDREVAELRDRDYRNGMEDGEMAAERDGWVRLPVDADGEVIHIGEMVDEKLPFGGYAAPAPIDTMELSRGASGYGWMVKLDSESGAFINPKLLRHHHAPTVEDVILDAISRCVGHSPEYWDKPIAECAAKLALRGDE